MDITSFVLSHRDRAFLIGDHGNYRALLSRQLATLRRRLGIATPKNAKYSAKPITASDIRSNVEYVAYLSFVLPAKHQARFAHILLLTAERAWAHAMHMKTSHSEDSASQKFPSSARSHIVSRFTKAAKHARILVELIRENIGSGTTTADVAEAEAYAAYLAGLAELDKHSPSKSETEGSGVAESWRKCLQNLAVAKVIYGALWKSARKDCFKDILSSTIDPTLRFAAYRSNIPRTVAIGEVARRCFPRDKEDLVGTVEDIDEDALDSEEEGMPMGGLPSTISWRSRKANIVDASIGQALVSVANAEQQLASLMSDGWQDLSAEARAAAYDEVLNACQDTVDATRHAIEDHEKEKIPEGDRRMQDLRVTNLAVNYDLIGWRVGRNRVLIGEQDGINTEQLSVKTLKRSRSGSQSVDKTESRSKRLARLQDRVVLYDAILQSIESVKDLRGAARDTEFMEELEAKKNYFHALKYDISTLTLSEDANLF
jgi:signal recognition particle subunit SRP68